MPNARDADGLNKPVGAAEARLLFAPLLHHSALLVAVSGGPDSMALLALLARWRAARRTGRRLMAATVDHGLRPESASEARTVALACRTLGVPHRVLRWEGSKPRSRIQERARDARYALLAAHAEKNGAAVIVTAHHRDDQAETVLFRLLRGSGLSGLRGMAADAPLAGSAIRVLRPLLTLPKSRLIATVTRAAMPIVDDPSNGNVAFARARLRGILPMLAEEGLGADGLVLLAERLRRADAAIEAMVDRLDAIATPDLLALPDEIGLRLLGRAIARAGNEGSVELGKLERLWDHLHAPSRRVRLTLAGAMVTRDAAQVTVTRAPPRRGGRNGPA